MIKLDTNSLSLVHPGKPNLDLQSIRRLIVLVPADADYTAATRRVWEIASTLGCDILLLSLCTDEAQESSLRRQLITMAAMVQDGRVCTEIRVEFGSKWMNAVKSSLQDGDMIVCFAEQRTGLLRKPMAQILHEGLDAPVYVLSGFFENDWPRPSWLLSLCAWTGFIAIIAGSFLLQTRITLLPEDWTQAVLLILSVIGEIWLIWGWNNLLG